MLWISDGSSEVGGDVRAALDQGGSRGASLHGQAREVVGRSPLVPRSDAWDLAPLAASSRGGLASCGGMRREPDVRQEFVERAGTVMRDFAAMDGVRVKTLIDIDSRRFDKAVAEVKERQGTAPGIVFGDFRGVLDDKDIDSLVVGTPDHWHAIPTVLGFQASKHRSRNRAPAGWVAWDTIAITEGRARFRIGTQWFSIYLALCRLVDKIACFSRVSLRVTPRGARKVRKGDPKR